MNNADEAVLFDIEDGVATITLNRPDQRNALSSMITAGIEDALTAVDTAGSDARCVVLEGRGDAFCAGGDIAAMCEGIENKTRLDERVRELERSTNEMMAQLVTYPLPTVAKIDGPAVGAGANLALACDLQLASDRANIGFVFRNVGLSVDAGTSYLLPRIVGENVAKELVFTGEMLDAERAEYLGLFNYVYAVEEFDEHADALIERITEGPTVALSHTKRLVSEGLRKPIEQAMRDEATAQGVVFDTADHEEGVRAFLEDREPEFEGR